MRICFAMCAAAGIALSLSSCEEKREVVISETRPATSRDKSPKLFASSDERFRNAKPSPVKADTPHGWLAVPATQFRLLNYRFGESGRGEVWVSISAGSVLDNLNRWLDQFGAKKVDQAGLAAIRDVPIAGTTGKWVEAEGDYASGMGSPTQTGYGLAGVVSEIRGNIVTVKMVGPAAEVAAEKTVLEEFAKSLKLAD